MSCIPACSLNSVSDQGHGERQRTREKGTEKEEKTERMRERKERKKERSRERERESILFRHTQKFNEI